MWVGGVEIPSELVDAHRAGRLVLFVGAGASRDSPADLPDFADLTRSVAQQAQYPLADGDLLHPDVVLGRIKDRGVDVHLRVVDLLSDPGSSHNSLHRAIADLGLAGPELRIVTTNFDRHLTSALRGAGSGHEEFTAPALPVGNDFTGLVYLHGALNQSSRRLIVTDDDFGTAYLRDAWAARFLERMFAEFHVLFIGYSHGDVVMRYLARALGPDGHRYVLTSNAGHQDWADLGLRPIAYEVRDGSHGALGGALARWAEVSRMGLLDHRSRVVELVAAPPSGIPEDESYLEELISDPDRVSFFTEAASGVEWLDWIAGHPGFTRLFVPNTQPAPTDRALAAWFVDRFVMHETTTDKALGTLAERGGFLGLDLCNCIGFHLNGLDGPRPAWLGIWLILLVRDAPASETNWLDYALSRSSWPEDRDHVLLLFDHLTEPIPALAPSLDMSRPNVGIHLKGDDYWLREAWQKLLLPNIAECATALIAIADRHLRRVRLLQVGAQPTSPNWDAVSWSRSAIEPHPQDEYDDPMDVLIDAARDSLEHLLESSISQAIAFLDAWATSGSQILQRLSIHGWVRRTDISADAKVDWLVEMGWMADHHVRHEAFRLVEHAIPDASDEAIERLIAAVIPVGIDEPELRGYERYNALVWMDRHRPHHPLIEAALTAAHAVNPTWEPRSDPDLTHSMSVGFVPPRPPMSTADFLDQLDDDPTALIAALQQSKEVRPWDGRPTWEDALALIRSSVEIATAAGFTLLDTNPTEDVTLAVIDGWARSDLSAGDADSVLERIAELDLGPLARDLARTLANGGNIDGYRTEWAPQPRARHLAQRLWHVAPQDGVLLGDVDWLAQAINHPGGNLAEFWLHVVQQNWRSDDDAWSGLTQEHTEALQTMLSSNPDEPRTQMAEIVCVSRLHFLFAADPAWATQHVLPLLDWSYPARAARCWSSFTSWGRWSDRLLDAGLMDFYLETVPHLDELDPDHRQRVLGHLAGIALTSERDPLQWLPGTIVRLDDDGRAAFADRVAGILDDLPEEAVEREWARWIDCYWLARLGSVPTTLSLAECTAMAGWVPFLTTSFDEGAERVLAQPGAFQSHSDVLRHLEARVDASPDTCAQLIGHLMCSTEPPWWGSHRLPKLMPRLQTGSEQAHIDVILEQALRLGLGNL